MRISKSLLGKVVEISLWDHNTKASDKSLTKCHVLGRIVKIDRNFVTLCYWHCEDNPHLNDESHNLIRSAIISIKVYQ